MTDPSYDECLVETELRARAAYHEPHRHYHDERHLDESLEELERVPGLSDRDSRLLKWAILWHDSIYQPGQRDNERRSASLAERELKRCSVPQEDCAEVARLIRATETHSLDPGDRLGRLIISIDLAILGSDADRYAGYTAAVRKEYSHVPDQLWRTGRALVLRRLLECDPLYPDPDFRSRLEDRARTNILAELSSLGED
jgi:predicted metal-dependent HD superfamily phosphohydrolase